MSALRLAYEVQGKGLPVVFLHAFPLNREMWKAVVAGLSGIRAILVDAPGFGESPIPGKPYDLADMARSVVEILDREGVDRAVVVGLSMGGYVAFRLYDGFWSRVQGMVLANTRAEMDSPEGRAAREKAIARIRSGDRTGYIEDLLPRLVGPTTLKSRPEVVARVKTLISRAPDDALVLALEAMKNRPDSVPMLPTVEVPALAIAGEEDGLIPPADMEGMVTRMPLAELVVLPRVGHLSALEDPEGFREALSRFLKQF